MQSTFFMLKTYNLKLFNLFFYLCMIFFTYNCAQHHPFMANGKRQVVKSYYKNGNIEYKSSYLNNKLDGPTYYYSKSDQNKDRCNVW